MTIVKNIKVVPYDPNWATIFATESALIKNALGENCIAVHHIGSTSVPDLLAKPKIDLIAEVVDPKKTIAALKPLDYEYRGEWSIPGKYGFRKRGTVNYNLHLFKKGHPEVELNLVFRDYLRANKEARDKYAKLKQDLLKDGERVNQSHQFFNDYTLGKDKLIREIIKSTGYNKLRIKHAAHYTEWDAIRDFTKKNITAEKEVNYNKIHMMLYQGIDICGYVYLEKINSDYVIKIIKINNGQECNKSSFLQKLCLYIEEEMASKLIIK